MGQRKQYDFLLCENLFNCDNKSSFHLRDSSILSEDGKTFIATLMD